MPKKSSVTIYPLAALRTAVLHTQLLTTPLVFTPDTIVNLVKTLGYVQIDTLHVVNRAHYVTLWARFGSYDIDDFHKLIYTADQRRLYEGWGHAASIMPMEHYRYHRWRTDQTISYNLTSRDHGRQTRQLSGACRRTRPFAVSQHEHDRKELAEKLKHLPVQVCLHVAVYVLTMVCNDRIALPTQSSQL
jgi:uncharacterized protein YcaQ